MGLLSSVKGMFGEGVINLTYRLTLDKEIYHQINNVTLPLENGGTTQIDHIIVSPFGVFVVETKNYKGWIFGSEKQAQWTQMFRNGKKFKFQNPLRQNYLHTQTLASLLELADDKFYSMVVFVGECEIKTKDELPDNVLQNGWIPYIKDKQQRILTDKQVKEVVDKIETGRLEKSFKTNAQHKQYLRSKKNAQENKLSHAVDKNSHNNANADNTGTPLCPRCNSPMTKRMAKTGKNVGASFWGCLQFPRCRGLLNI